MACSLSINRSPTPSPRFFLTPLVDAWRTDQARGQLPLSLATLVASPRTWNAWESHAWLTACSAARLRHSSPCRTTRTSTRGVPQTMTAACRTTEIDAATAYLGRFLMPSEKTGTAGTRPPLPLPRVAATPPSLPATNHPSPNWQSPIPMPMSLLDGLITDLEQVSSSFLLLLPSSFSSPSPPASCHHTN